MVYNFLPLHHVALPPFCKFQLDYLPSNELRVQL